MGRTRQQVLIGVGAVVIVVAIILGVVALTHRHSSHQATTTTTTSSTSSSSTTSSTTTTTAPTTTTTVSTQELDAAVFPDLTTNSRYKDPTDLVRDFAQVVLGFNQSAAIGQLQPTGPGTGTIDIVPAPGGAPTTVLLAQEADGTWIALSARTASIRLDTPSNGARISSPQALMGAAYAFEGRVNVTLYADGSDTQIASTFVTGRGDGVLGPFTGQLQFQVPPGTTRGILVFSAAAASDGTTAAATAIRVHF